MGITLCMFNNYSGDSQNTHKQKKQHCWCKTPRAWCAILDIHIYIYGILNLNKIHFTPYSTRHISRIASIQQSLVSQVLYLWCVRTLQCTLFMFIVIWWCTVWRVTNVNNLHISQRFQQSFFFFSNSCFSIDENSWHEPSHFSHKYLIILVSWTCQQVCLMEKCAAAHVHVQCALYSEKDEYFLKIFQTTIFSIFSQEYF